MSFNWHQFKTYRRQWTATFPLFFAHIIVGAYIPHPQDVRSERLMDICGVARQTVATAQ